MSKLQDYINTEAAKREPFSWDKRNCFTFTAGWVQLVYGVDVLAGQGSASGPLEARQLVGDCEERWTCALDTNSIDGWQARVGDVVMMISPGNGLGYTMGVCVGRKIATIGEDGSVRYESIMSAERAWRIIE